ncbi:hypothetical protein B9Z55_027875 [Caenorhabditis nigoni]|uniref:Uncharacterized protein n=1 Tax=Caenorhabditis nigoni TaxID=1611254 RepID=A0A2G5SDT6_9PELO|nr:hypothetical protein B9Z55_027875 [Caenorhabditis nigoni]
MIISSKIGAGDNCTDLCSKPRCQRGTGHYGSYIRKLQPGDDVIEGVLRTSQMWFAEVPLEKAKDISLKNSNLAPMETCFNTRRTWLRRI